MISCPIGTTQQSHRCDSNSLADAKVSSWCPLPYGRGSDLYRRLAMMVVSFVGYSANEPRPLTCAGSMQGTSPHFGFSHLALVVPISFVGFDTIWLAILSGERRQCGLARVISCRPRPRRLPERRRFGLRRSLRASINRDLRLNFRQSKRLLSACDVDE